MHQWCINEFDTQAEHKLHAFGGMRLIVTSRPKTRNSKTGYVAMQYFKSQLKGSFLEWLEKWRTLLQISAYDLPRNQLRVWMNGRQHQDHQVPFIYWGDYYRELVTSVNNVRYEHVMFAKSQADLTMYQTVSFHQSTARPHTYKHLIT